MVLHDSSEATWMKVIAYGTSAFSVTLLNNVFIGFYVVMYSTSYNLTDYWFFVGQVIFIIWNSINDPLFALFSPPQRRISIIKWGGPLFALSFLLPWFPWFTSSSPSWMVGLHYIISLCLYDGLYTLVVLNHSALLADISPSVKVRSSCSASAAVFSVVGSVGVFAAQRVWNPADISYFRYICVVVSGVACTGFYFTASMLDMAENTTLLPMSDRDRERERPTFDSEQAKQDIDEIDETSAVISKSFTTIESREPKVRSSSRDMSLSSGTGHLTSTSPLRRARNDSRLSTDSISISMPARIQDNSKVSFIRFVKQIMRQKNFLIFVLVNLIQVTSCSFNSNYFSIFATILLGPMATPDTLAMMVGTSFILPGLLTAFLSRIFVPHWGVAPVLRYLFLTKASLPFITAILLTIWNFDWIIIAVFFVLNRCIAESTMSLNTLAVADIIDEDRALHSRPYSYSSMVFGLNALITKPGQSLGPMLGWLFMSSYFASSSLTASDGELASIAKIPDAVHTSMYLVLVFPIVTAVIQLIAWHFYTLTGAWLVEIKQLLGLAPKKDVHLARKVEKASRAV